MITYDVNLCLGKDNPDKKLAVKCHDTGVNIRAHLQYCLAGKWHEMIHPYAIPEGTTAVLKITKPDKKYCITDGTVESNSVLFDLVPQAFTAPGVCRAEVSLFGPDGKRITSGTFYIEVPEECICDCEMESENYIDVMSEQIRAAIEAAARAEAAIVNGPIIKDGTWWVWGQDDGKYVDTGVRSSVPGPNGISVTHEWDGTTLKVTSASGTSSADLKGEPGYTPVKDIDYFDGKDGAVIHYINTAIKTVDDPISNPGSYMVPPNVGDSVITTDYDLYMITAVDAETGKVTAKLMGNIKGDPGYTPQKGVDYYTPEEEAVFVGYMNAARKSAEEAAASAVEASYTAGNAWTYAEIAMNNAKSAEESAIKAGASATDASMAHEAARMEAQQANEYAQQASQSANDAALSEQTAGDLCSATYSYMETTRGYMEFVADRLGAVLISGTASGKVPNITDAANMPMQKFTVNDGTNVETVKAIGKNFINNELGKTVTHIGVTAEWDAENHEFVLNGKTTSAGDLKLIEPLKLDWVVGETYTFTARRVSGTAILADGTNGTTFSWGLFQNNAAKYTRGSVSLTEFPETYNFTATAFELDDNKHLILYFQCWRPGTVFENYRVRVQLEKGKQITDWEAYREESTTIGGVQTMKLHKGHNNIVTVPPADITVDYIADTKLYIDNKLANL